MQFIDLKQQYQKLKNNIDKSIKNVIDEGSFIQGDQVKILERRLSDYIGGGYCISCANGTDALYIALRALNVKSGDEVIVPSFTWVSTAEVVKLLDAVPVFADVDQKTFNISVKDISKKITQKTKAIIPVSLFGLCANIYSINNIAKKYKSVCTPDFFGFNSNLELQYRGRFDDRKMSKQMSANSSDLKMRKS